MDMKGGSLMLKDAHGYPEDKAELYALLQKELLALVEGAPQPVHSRRQRRVRNRGEGESDLAGRRCT